jgi:hypothetical protein
MIPGDFLIRSRCFGIAKLIYLQFCVFPGIDRFHGHIVPYRDRESGQEHRRRTGVHKGRLLFRKNNDN